MSKAEHIAFLHTTFHTKLVVDRRIRNVHICPVSLLFHFLCYDWQKCLCTLILKLEFKYSTSTVDTSNQTVSGLIDFHTKKGLVTDILLNIRKSAELIRKR